MTGLGYTAVVGTVLCALVALSQIRTPIVVFDMSQLRDSPLYIPGQGLLLSASNTVGISTYPAGADEATIYGSAGGRQITIKGHNLTVAEALMDRQTRYYFLVGTAPEPFKGIAAKIASW